jgi:hypothetical protein
LNTSVTTGDREDCERSAMFPVELERLMGAEVHGELPALPF